MQSLNVSYQTVYRWRKRFRNADPQANLLTDLRENNAGTKKLRQEQL